MARSSKTTLARAISVALATPVCRRKCWSELHSAPSRPRAGLGTEL